MNGESHLEQEKRGMSPIMPKSNKMGANPSFTQIVLNDSKNNYKQKHDNKI